jgi:hypothetical protein
MTSKSQGNVDGTLQILAKLPTEFTHIHIAKLTGLTTKQTSKVCSYLKNRGFFKVVSLTETPKKRGYRVYELTALGHKLKLAHSNVLQFPGDSRELDEIKAEAATKCKEGDAPLREVVIRTLKLVGNTSKTFKALTTAMSELLELLEAAATLQRGLEKWDKK